MSVPKKFLVVYWHAEPKSMCGSMYTAAIEALTAAGHEVKTTNLFEMRFDAGISRADYKSAFEPSDPGFFKPQAENLKASQENGFNNEIAAEHAKLAWCDVLIMQFPLYWFSVPAVMKGWVDRVFSMGVAYGGPVGIYETGPYKGKKAILSFTTGGPEVCYQPGGFNGDLNGVLRPIHRGILEFCGFSVLRPNPTWSPARIEDAERKKYIADWKERVVGLAEEEPIVVGHYQ